MPTGMAVVCDTDDCFAVYLAVETGDDEDARSASEVSQLARDAAQGEGWVVSFGFRQPVMTCPGCADAGDRCVNAGTAGGAWAASTRPPGACTACAKWSLHSLRRDEGVAPSLNSATPYTAPRRSSPPGAVVCPDAGQISPAAVAVSQSAASTSVMSSTCVGWASPSWTT